MAGTCHFAILKLNKTRKDFFYGAVNFCLGTSIKVFSMIINEIILLYYTLYLCLCLLELDLSVVEMRCLEEGSTSNLGLSRRSFRERALLREPQSQPVSDTLLTEPPLSSDRNPGVFPLLLFFPNGLVP